MIGRWAGTRTWGGGGSGGTEATAGSDRPGDRSDPRDGVFQRETGPAEEKVVSIFEEDTDIIGKGQRETTFGRNGGQVLAGAELLTFTGQSGRHEAMPMLDRQSEIYGRYPRQASLDGGSPARRTRANEAGEEDQGPGLR